MTEPISDQDLSILRDNIEAHPGGTWTCDLDDIKQLVARVDELQRNLRDAEREVARLERRLDECGYHD